MSKKKKKKKKKRPKRVAIIAPDTRPVPLGVNKYAVIVTNCNSCWAVIDDRLEICPKCGKKTF